MKLTLNHPLFQSALPLIQRIESHGYEAYFIGGCVRDTLLNRPINDIDIATSAFPQEIAEIFSHTVDVGIEHGTIGIVYHGELYEVTTFRSESTYTDHRRPDEVTFIRSLEEDTLRRDFTINALAFDVRGKLYDYHGGLDDLQQKIIRCVGQPYERFNEDALRMMRAIRFASQLGFKIEDNTLQAIETLSPSLAHIAIERIRIEFIKFLEGDYFKQTAHLLETTHLSAQLPGFDQVNVKRLLDRLIEKVKPLQASRSQYRELIWAFITQLLGYSEQETMRYLKDWTHSNDFIRQVVQIRELLDLIRKNQVTAMAIYTLDTGVIRQVQDYLDAHHLSVENYLLQKEQLPIQTRKELAIDGKRLMDMFNLNRGGPMIGEILANLEMRVINRQLENKSRVLEDYVRQHYSVVGDMNVK